ncbi:hypothetical protein BJ165DRAFT_1356155 [Panaeolus papilionaceus]|nr:hypothetical protein BJ165DRAFT_1356155 [Panaeolus papilionaceus]
MKAFFDHLLRFVPNSSLSDDVKHGVLGPTSAYYGCVEAQGRGTLHCHMLVWLHGSINPDKLRSTMKDDPEFRLSFVTYLEQVVCTHVPNVPQNQPPSLFNQHHSCKLRPPPLVDTPQANKLRQEDLAYLVERCQRHYHSDTCYKYWKGPGDRKECRFHLDADQVQSTTVFNEETGEFKLRRLDGTLNNYNSVILQNMRCNMDIKHIGSGTSSKAILYYVTDYITKSALKVHVAFSALEVGITKLGTFNPAIETVDDRSKALLQKCAFSLLSRQELSMQQVASSLLGIGDHYSSHEFHQFHWPDLMLGMGYASSDLTSAVAQP